MKVFPNPAIDYITIQYRTADKMIKNLELVIQDASGRKIMQKQLKGGDNDELIDLSSFISRIYSVILYADILILNNFARQKLFRISNAVQNGLRNYA
ncbi:MAG: T9SS type A sorting domain-containing protein [Saprospiraceae bacterium]|nr:T9SS type A sorting domain-containing protein [Saprospiraceae bacterium]